MLVTADWINDYLENNISANEQGELLTAAGFPLEGTEELPDGDVRQEFEMTSNRGDCTCHLGLAREIAARTMNDLVEPKTTIEATGSPIEESASVINHEPDLCPLYTARVILGASVNASPSWLETRIANRGDTPRNAIVDAANFVLFEMGQPTHVFDLDKLAGNRIEIRRAKKGETLLPIGEGASEIKLTTDDLVIADAEKPVALAGVKGGAETAVTSKTKNMLIESATFDPVVVREMSRRHNVASDSSYRFERGVSPLQIHSCAERLVGLLLEIGGGELCTGVLSDGKPLPELRTATMRTSVCTQRLGIEIPDETILNHLNRVGFDATLDAGVISCTIPCYRGDIHREIDLIEEVGRIHGFDQIPIEEAIKVKVPASGGEADGRQAVLNTLAGMGFVECVTHSLISTDAAEQFLLDGQSPVLIDGERAVAEPALRPSILPSLLTVRKHNADNGVKNLRIAELGSVYALQGNEHTETTELAIVMDAGDDEGIGAIRGVVNQVCTVVSASTEITVSPEENVHWLEPSGLVSVNGTVVGRIGRLSESLQKKWDLPTTVHVAQLHLGDLLTQFPPEKQSTSLPKQPAIERDITIIVDEKVLWSDLCNGINTLNAANLEEVTFVTTFRGKNIASGKKSLTLRLRFRDAKRTLTHDEVNEPVTAVIEILTNSFGAEIRS